MLEAVLLIPLLVIVVSLIALSWFAGSDAPYLPTQEEVIKNILRKAGVKKTSVFYELGSGDGRVVITAGELGAASFGVEQSWLRVFYSRYKARKMKLKNVQFFHGSIYDREYFPADVVYIFLLQPAVDRLEKKLQLELKKGAKVIVKRDHFKKWKPIATIDDFCIYEKK